MTIEEVVAKRTVVQQYKNWIVLDEECQWNIEILHSLVFQIIDKEIDIPVLFCHLNEAKKIMTELGEEEDEYLQYASGLYISELHLVFICQWEELLPFVETLFHEFRHVMQDQDTDFRHHFESDKSLPYQERITEIDAFQYAKDKVQEIVDKEPFTYNFLMNLTFK